jgi:hypothetical protein
MSKGLEIFYLDNVAKSDTFTNVSADLDKDIWQYGMIPAPIGGEIEDTAKFWYTDMVKNRWQELLFHEIIDKLEALAPNTRNYKFKSLDVKAGGKTFGLDGTIHTDRTFEFNAEGDGYMTFCYFPNREWDADWGGELQFFDTDGNIIASYLPLPNTCIVFDSNIPHRGLAPNRDCRLLRKYVSYKTFVHKNWIAHPAEIVTLK